MSKIQLKVVPSLAKIFNAPDSGWVILEQEIEEGTTVSDLFTTLSTKYPDFRKVVFDTYEGKVSDQIVVILNDSLLPFLDVLDTYLNDGDIVTLLPVYTGG